MAERFDIRARARSFVHAFRGVGDLFAREHNARIHLLVAAVVVALAGWLGVSRTDWALIALAVGGVLMAEALNAGLESLADALHPDIHPLVGRAKDLAAGGVLLMAVAAAVVGLLTLGPPLWRWLTGAPGA